MIKLEDSVFNAKNYHLVLQRETLYKDVEKPRSKKQKEDSVIGILKLYFKNELMQSYITLENGGVQTHLNGKDKRIMQGIYNLEWSKTSKNGMLRRCFKEWCVENNKTKAILLTQDSINPEFRKRRILIQTGKYPQDTYGSIILGFEDKKDGSICKSSDAINNFYTILKTMDISKITLEIKDMQ